MITIEIKDRDIGDLVRMVDDFTKNRGNTFQYILRDIREKYPKLAERLSVSET